MIFWISGVGSRALSTGKGLEAVAALVFEFDKNSSSFGQTCRVFSLVDFRKNSSMFLFFLSLSNRIERI